MKYNINNKKAIKAWINDQVANMTEAMYGDLAPLEAKLTKMLKQSRLDSFKLATELRKHVEELPNPELTTPAYIKQVQALTEDKELRGKLYHYRNLASRITLCHTNLDSTLSKKRISYKIRKILESVVLASARNKANSVSMGEVTHMASKAFKVTEVVTKSGNSLGEPNAWGMDTLCIQLASELCELDYLNMEFINNTHMLSIPDAISSSIPKKDWLELAAQCKILSRKTILTTPPTIQEQMVSTSSWWYKTPELSPSMTKFFNIMSNITFEFKQSAPTEISELYRQHLDLPRLPKWAKLAVDEYQDQIAHSFTAGGHYIAGQIDSVGRYYYQAEVGHFQTSHALRSIVTVKDIPNPVKYDMRNNVTQMYAVGLGNRDLAKYVGLVQASEEVGDLRETIAQRLNNELQVTVFNKANIKPLFMVWAYNAGKDRLLQGVTTKEENFFTGQITYKVKVEGLLSLTNHKIPEDKVWTVWNTIINELCPAIVALKVVFKRLIKANPLTEVQWTLPDGGIAQYTSVETLNNELNWVSSNGKQRTHTHHRKEIAENAKSAGLLPRVIHSIDAYFMRQIVLRAHDLGITVIPNHDSFMFDEQHIATINNMAKELLVEIMEQNVLGNIVEQLNKAKAPLAGGIKIASKRLSVADIMAGNPMDTEEI